MYVVVAFGLRPFAGTQEPQHFPQRSAHGRVLDGDRTDRKRCARMVKAVGPRADFTGETIVLKQQRSLVPYEAPIACPRRVAPFGAPRAAVVEAGVVGQLKETVGGRRAFV